MRHWVGIVVLSIFALAACGEKLTGAELLARAQTAFDIADIRAAEIDVKAALQLDKENAAARRLYGEIFLYKMNGPAAVTEFRRSLATAESSITRLLLAKASLRAGESDQFFADWESGHYQSIDVLPEFHAVVARGFFAQRNIEEGERHLLTAAEGSDEANDYIEITRAIAALVRERDFDAISILESVVARSPEQEHAWSLLGEIAARNEDFKQAAIYFQKAVDLNAYRVGDALNLTDVYLTLEQLDLAEQTIVPLESALGGTPSVVLLRGMLQLKRGDSQQALVSFNDVLAKNERDPRALFFAAQINSASGNYDSALAQLKLLNRLAPENQEIRLLLGAAQLRQGDFRGAEKIARQIKEEEPVNSKALGLLGAALSSLGMHAESASAYSELSQLSPDSAAVAAAAGIEQFRGGNVDGAVDQLRAAVDLDPRDVSSWGLLLEALLAKGDLDAALIAATDMEQAIPDNAEVLIHKGRVEWFREDYEAAVVSFQGALELDPGNVNATIGLASIATLSADIGTAEALFREALAVHPESLVIAMNLAVLFQESGNLDAMETTLAEAMRYNPQSAEPAIALARLAVSRDRPGEAISLLTGLDDVAAEDYRVHQVLAGTYLLVGQLDAASSSARRLMELRVDDPEALAVAAEVEVARGRLEQAQQLLEKALSLAPEAPGLRLMLVDILMSQGAYGDAAREVARLPEEILESTSVLARRSRLAMEAGDNATAVLLSKKVFEAQPSSVNLVSLSRAEWQQGQREGSADRLDRWLGENPNDSLVRYELATRQLELGQEEAASANYETLLEAQPDNAVVLNNLAWLLRESDTARALMYVQRAAEIAPQSAQVKDTFSMVLLESGDTERALELNVDALQAMPGNADLKLNRARILLRDGQRGEAEIILRELLEDSSFGDKDQALELLDQL